MTDHPRHRRRYLPLYLLAIVVGLAWGLASPASAVVTRTDLGATAPNSPPTGITVGGNWSNGTDASAIGGSYWRTNAGQVAGAVWVQIAFTVATGNEATVAFIAPKTSSTCNALDWSLDSGAATGTVSGHNSTAIYNQTYFTTPAVGPGAHTLRVSRGACTVGDRWYADAFDVDEVTSTTTTTTEAPTTTTTEAPTTTTTEAPTTTTTTAPPPEAVDESVAFQMSEPAGLSLLIMGGISLGLHHGSHLFRRGSS